MHLNMQLYIQGNEVYTRFKNAVKDKVKYTGIISIHEI